MKVTAKLVSTFLLGMFIVTGVSAWLEIQRESREFHRLVDEECRLLGQFLDRVIGRAWETGSEEGALQLLNNMQPRTQEARVSWVWFDAGSGPHRPMASTSDLQRVLLDQTPTVVVDSIEQSFVCDYWPVDVPGVREGGLQFVKPITALLQTRNGVIAEMIAFIASMLLVSGIVITVVGVRFVGRPLSRLIKRTDQIAGGDFDSRVELRSNDELSQLAESLNGMCEELKASQDRIEEEAAARLAATEQLRHDDRLRTVGRLASGVAHELGTPLSVVSGRAQLIAGGKLVNQEVTTSAKTIQHEANRMTTIIRHLLDFARRRTPQRSAVDVRRVVDQSAKLLESLAKKNSVEIAVRTDDAPCVAKIDSGQIEQVLSNLVVNAIQSMPDGGVVEVDVTRRRSSSGPDNTPHDYVCVDIRDQGLGVSQDDLPHLFEPFFTTKAIGEGTGLGLSISYGIMREHGGFIDVQSEPGKGSCFSIFLPVGDSSETPDTDR